MEKTGAGFRQYVGKRGKPAPDPAFAAFLERHRTDSREFTNEEIEDRLLLPMLMEATRILEENIVREPAHVDMGPILGIGFPPFRGGLLHWCDQEGAGNIMSRLKSIRRWVSALKRRNCSRNWRTVTVDFSRSSFFRVHSRITRIHSNQLVRTRLTCGGIE